jgi:hypothetical protein
MPDGTTEVLEESRLPHGDPSIYDMSPNPQFYKLISGGIKSTAEPDRVDLLLKTRWRIELDIMSS